MIEEKRAGFIAVIGSPNAGKSTLINHFIGQKVTIVTRKVQTTRSVIRGICIHKESQLVFSDTPGIFEPKRRLDRAMVQRGAVQVTPISFSFYTMRKKVE